MTPSTEPPPAPLRAPLALVASLCAVFVISQFYRSAIAVIAPDLSQEMNLSAETLGLLSGAFFIASAAMQIPVGILLDRYGPRRVLPAMLAFTIGGAVLFASGEGPWQLIPGQFLIGAGCSGVFIGGLVAVSRWFPPDRFTTVGGVMIAVSNIGTLLSGTPLALAVEAVGWRMTVLGTGLLTGILALVVLVLVRDAPPGHSWFRRTPETLGQTVRGVGEVLRHPLIWPLAAIAFFTYASSFTIRGLWGGPWLADVYGLDALGRGHVLLAMSAATLIGVAVWGPVNRALGSYRRPVTLGALGGVLSLALLAGLPSPPLWLAVLLLCSLAGFASYYALMLAHGRTFFPDRLVGRAMTVINFATFAGVSVMQVLSGVLVGLFPAGPDGDHPVAAYRLLFAILGATLLFAVLVYRRVPDRPADATGPAD